MNYSLHNVAQTISNSDGSKKIVRLPETVRLQLETESGKKVASYAPSGCEIRFVLTGSAAVLRLVYNGDARYAPSIYMYLGDFQSGWLWLNPIRLNNGINEIEIKYPDNMDHLRKIAKENNFGFSPDVIRISGLSSNTEILGIEGDTRPPKSNELPEKTILFYGSSITHGSLSLNINSCYAALIGRNLGYDVINKGLAGSCYLEKAMVDYVFEYDADCLVIELGTNCYREDKDDWFADRVKYILETHEKLCPQKPLFLIDCFRACCSDACKQTVKKCIGAKEYSNVTYIDGFDILPGNVFYSADLVHPSIDSHFIMAEKITNIIRNKL